jgi:hypothetical protein
MKTKKATKPAAKPTAKPTGKQTEITVDFSGVETGSFGVHIPEDEYKFQITKVVKKKGSDSGEPYLLFTFKAIDGNKKGIGKSLPHTCSLQAKALWNLKQVIESCGKAVPSKAVKLVIEKMVGWECAGTVVDDEYNGKKKSVISAFYPVADFQAPGSEMEEPEEEGTEEEEEEGTEEETTEEEETGEEEELFS